MPPTNLYQDLKTALTEFKTFLDTNVPVIKPAITALKSVIPQLGDLLAKLIELMGKLKTEITNLDVGAVPGLSQVSQFTQSAKTLLTTAKNLLPAEAATIDQVLGVIDVVSGLPTLDQVKAEILTLIDEITAKLNDLNS